MPVKRVPPPNDDPPNDQNAGWAWVPGFPGPDVWKLLGDEKIAHDPEYLDTIGDMLVQHGQMLVKHGQSLKRIAKLRSKKGSSPSSGGEPDAGNT